MRLTKDDWTAAALRALAEGGVAAVAIEPLAASLGTTKGSAYWHFPNREALLVATLERWEREVLTGMVEAEPVERLRRLLAAEDGARIELALLASAGETVVGASVRRITAWRLGHLATLFGQLGLPPAQARRRALLAHSLYLGQAQLARAVPDVLPSSAAGRRAHTEDALRAMTGR